MTAPTKPEPFTVEWVLECGCEPGYTHCEQCDSRRAQREARETVVVLRSDYDALRAELAKLRSTERESDLVAEHDAEVSAMSAKCSTLGLEIANLRAELAAEQASHTKDTVVFDEIVQDLNSELESLRKVVEAARELRCVLGPGRTDGQAHKMLTDHSLLRSSESLDAYDKEHGA